MPVTPVFTGLCYFTAPELQVLCLSLLLPQEPYPGRCQP